MKESRLLGAVCATLLLYGITPCDSATPSFMGLGSLNSFGSSRAIGVSADGLAVAGCSGLEAFRWTYSDGMIGLGITSSSSSSCAGGISADGKSIAGHVNIPYASVEASLWTQNQGMVGLGYLPGITTGISQGNDISDDGRTVVGRSTSVYSNNSWEAFRWTVAGGMIGLGDLPGGYFSSNAAAVSADGSVIVGNSSSGQWSEAFRWTKVGGMIGLGDLKTSGDAWSGANDITPDGSIIVGFAQSDNGFESFCWSLFGGMKGLGDFPGGEFNSNAYGISANGSIIVGEVSTGVNVPGGREAFIWDSANVMQKLSDVLVDILGLDLNGWILTTATGVSDDGLTIVGNGINPLGFEEAWIADISGISLPPRPVDLGGTIKTIEGQDICAMVLASGQFMFSCNPTGEFLLSGLLREDDGLVKRQIYADGFFPKIDILPSSSDDVVVMKRSGICPSYNTPYDQSFVPVSAGKRIYITGKVLSQYDQTPICAMVLANGQHMFSCDGSGNYSLDIPLDTNGQFKLQVYADGFAPTIQTFDEFKTINDVRMARALECQ